MISIDEFLNMEGRSLGHSDWFEIDQKRIDQFADATNDPQFIHVDVERAKAETPFGGTIAHGFLTLSMLSHLTSKVLPTIADKRMTLNYGLNKVRFLAPVATGSRVRVHVTILSIVEKQPGRVMCVFESKVEIEGHETPALVAEQILLHVMKDAA